MSVTLVLPVPPASNRYWRKFRNTIVKSPEARAYQLEVKRAWARERLLPIVGAVAVTLRWYRAAKRGDLDGRLKVVLDCLQGLAYENDKQIIRILAERHEDPANPRLEVEIKVA